MVKQGYSKPFACAVTAAGSIIGPTIPPSTLMVIYGSIMGVSIAGLFAAGIIPGLLICFVCMALIAIFGKKWGLPKSGHKPSIREIIVAIRESLVALVMPIIVLGGIMGGLTTPTEAAAIAVLYALVVGSLVYRSLTLEDLLQMLIRTSLITGVIFLIIASASIVGWWMTFEQIPQAIANSFLEVSDNPYVIITMILALLLVIGLFMDINATLIILSPVLGPLLVSIGMEPVHAGVMIILALNISLMTPPVGACLFVLSSVTGAKIEEISKSLWPFLLVEIAVLFLIAYWADLTLFLPRLLGFS